MISALPAGVWVCVIGVSVCACVGVDVCVHNNICMVIFSKFNSKIRSYSSFDQYR